MADPSTIPAPAPTVYPALESPVAVISAQFCHPYPVDLKIVKKSRSITGSSRSEIIDANGSVMLKTEGSFFSLHGRLLLLDTSGNPLISFQHKLISAHKKWYVFRGESSDSKDLLFEVKKSSFFQRKIKSDVILAADNKTSENTTTCDFKVKGTWKERPCTIYLGDGSTNTIIAKSNRYDKDVIGMTVYPNVDYVFVVALVVILQEIGQKEPEPINLVKPIISYATKGAVKPIIFYATGMPL